MKKTPPASSPATRKVMQANRGVDSLIELELRSIVHKSGLRYSINSRPLPELNRRADLVFRSAKVAVFVHGCFWHGCKWHFKAPKTNRAFWKTKIERNKKRDKETRIKLRKNGWFVLTFWEHQDVNDYSGELIKIVRRRRTELIF